jgi:hypothetical protein
VKFVSAKNDIGVDAIDTICVLVMAVITQLVSNV